MRSILVAAAVSFLLSLIGTPLVIGWFRNRGFGQVIRDEGPEAHQAKHGTPTMGGTAIVVSAVGGYLAAHAVGVRFTPLGILVVGTFVGMAAVGFFDDLIKLRMQRSLGLNKTAKFAGQATIALLFGYFGPVLAGLPQDFSIVGTTAIALPTVVFLFWMFLLLTGVSNAVNLTDGLDGLAAGSGAMVFGAYTIISFWQFRHPADYSIAPADALDLAVISAAALAACAGFLWWNAPPARIFMGDTGSLAIGGLVAALGVASSTQLLLVMLGGLFVVETLSVIAQVFSFRVLGRRVLRMAPIHHHFELAGWQESTVIVRFWILAAIGAALGLGTFYAEFLARVGTGG